ncbi:MAG: DNA polymerase III subunit gamma/tau [Candidatus Ordinivivax streblomastigis]|uniref:DNA polymerase III subunit gamma/tau n=1 Tax=Candidatus Ordinivivax streblomastigis TaxID=2540710 RepID=A0A5M8P282_9BACT|nr:MAG: DNA polymerase III subunit gamma/tau [Candidatus Ordinivivax streblomastigis]
MFFKDIIGQNDIKQRLIQSVKEGFIPHARLISGPEGSGALSLALAYARYVHCTNRQESDACGTCPSCRQFNKLSHPDLHFVFPVVNKKGSKDAYCDDFLPEWRKFLAENTYPTLPEWLQVIGGENAHAIYARESNEITRKLNYKAYESDYKIMIIWYPEQMTDDGANKLLKLLEEPPAKTIFLLVSEDPEKVITTIRSRAQALVVPPIGDEALAQALQTKYTLPAEDIQWVLRLANGNYNAAIAIIDSTGENEAYLGLFTTIMRNSWKRDVQNMRVTADQFAAMGRDKQKAFFAYCQRMMRENFLYRLQQPEINYMNRKEAEFAVNFHPFVKENNIIEFMDELALAERHIEANVNSRMIFFDLSMKIAVLLKK